MKKEDYHKYHRELWDWLAENPENEDGGLNNKGDWPKWESVERGPFYGGIRYTTMNGEQIASGCFACAGCLDCGTCPITWSSDCCSNCESEYDQWVISTDPAERSRLAAIIRDLPWEDKL